MSKPGFATIFTIPTGMLNHLDNETKTDQTVQIYRLSFPLVVRIWYKLVFWREIKTSAHLRHCRDSSKVKSLHLGSAMSPESPAPREPGIQMTGALLLALRIYGFSLKPTIESETITPITYIANTNKLCYNTIQHNHRI